MKKIVLLIFVLIQMTIGDINKSTNCQINNKKNYYILRIDKMDYNYSLRRYMWCEEGNNTFLIKGNYTDIIKYFKDNYYLQQFQITDTLYNKFDEFYYVLDYFPCEWHLSCEKGKLMPCNSYKEWKSDSIRFTKTIKMIEDEEYYKFFIIKPKPYQPGRFRIGISKVDTIEFCKIKHYEIATDTTAIINGKFKISNPYPDPPTNEQHFSY